MNAPADTPLANLDPTKAANDLASLLEGRPVAPLQPRGARLVKPLDSPLDDESEQQPGTCRDCGAPTGRKNSKVCTECRESKTAARKRRTDQPQEREESAMPRGVYDRKKKGEGGGGDTPKQKRKYARRERPATEDPKALAQEALISAGEHLFATVQEQVDVGDNPELKAALRSYEIAQKIAKAVG